MGIFSELRRRNVLRMTVLYAAAAFVVMQVAEIVFGFYNVQEQFGQMLLAVLAVGFPIALVFSWFFELTPEGIVLDKDAPTAPSATPFGGRRVDFVIIAILSAGLLLFAYDKWWETGPEDLSIAVLPFANLSDDPDQGYFSDGLSEELINRLAQIPQLKVIARHSSFAYKGKDVKIADIAADLKVRYVVEGSVRRSGGRVRITAQLIDANDSSHLFSRTFDKDYDAESIFSVQIEVARAITSELHMTLTGEEEQRLASVPTTNTKAYEAYVLGRMRLTDRKVDELADAVDQFARAVELDAGFAGAYSGLVDACGLYYDYSGGHQHERCPGDVEGLVQLARKAVELDESLGEAWVSLGSALSSEAGNFSFPGSSPEKIAKLKKAHNAYERGLSLNPGQAQGYLWYASSLAAPGFYDSWDSWLEAWKADTWQSVVKRGVEIDPLSITLHAQLAEYSMWASTKGEALYHARRMIEIAPDSPRGYAKLSLLSWALSSRIDESIRWTNKAVEIDPLHPTYAMQTALGYATLGDIDMAMAYWDKAAKIFANDALPEKMHVLRALILLSNKDGVPMQQVMDALEPVRIDNINRIEIETFLATLRGDAKNWRSRHAELLSECLNSPIDDMYFGKWPNCGVWLDAFLYASGDIDRARATARKRIDWNQPWIEFAGSDYREPASYLILGEEATALDVYEVWFATYRGNPYTFRLYLYENLRFLLYHDPLSEPIRDHPRFLAAVAKVEADLAQQLENVRDMERKGELPTLQEMQESLVATSR